MDLERRMDELGRAARAAGRRLAASGAAERNGAIERAAELLLERAEEIAAASAADVEAARGKRAEAFLDRLALDRARIEGLAEELREVAALPDLLGATGAEAVRPNGLRIARMRMPIGVIGMIYEARPGVTVEAGSLCVKAGNAAILRSGSDAQRTSELLAGCLQDGLEAAGLPRAGAQLVPTADRAAVDCLLRLDRWVDMIIPRGGKELIERVRDRTRIPVLKHLDGVCHVYLDDAADAAKAVAIAVNAKTQRYGVCNAMETLLVAQSRAAELLPELGRRYAEHGVELRGCAETRRHLPQARSAAEEDWTAEYLAPVLAVRVVDGLDAAIEHIERYGSHHTDAIVTEDRARADRFLREVDSSSVMVNASTRFADGFEYGLGAEIGISTDRLHARGPVALEGLTNQKYVVVGDGQVRA